MAKNIIHAIEDCIIPLILRELFKTLINAHPKGTPITDELREWFTITNNYINAEYANIHPKFKTVFNGRLAKILSAVMAYMERNKFGVNKGLLILVKLAEEIQSAPEIDKILIELAKRGNKRLDDNDLDLDRMLQSVEKQAPKILLLIQQMGYFK